MNTNKKKDDGETLTEQQKRNRREYIPERWAMICPACKVFHNPRTPCGAIAAQIAERERQGKLKK